MGGGGPSTHVGRELGDKEAVSGTDETPTAFLSLSFIFNVITVTF